MKRYWIKLAEESIFYGVLAILLFFFLFLFFWMIMSSFKTVVQITAYPPQWFFTPTFQNYIDVFTKNQFLEYLKNSTIIAVAAVGIGLLFGLPAAYSLARFKQAKLGFVILLVRILPGSVTVFVTSIPSWLK